MRGHRPHTTPRPDTIPAVHPLQVRVALALDGDRPARPATVRGTAGDAVQLRLLDGTPLTVRVADPGRLGRVLARGDLCRRDGAPLALVSTPHGVLAVATGPAAAPERIEVLLVSVIEDGSVVELLGHDDQPGWQLLALRPES